MNVRGPWPMATRSALNFNGTTDDVVTPGIALAKGGFHLGMGEPGSHQPGSMGEDRGDAVERRAVSGGGSIWNPIQVYCEFGIWPFWRLRRVIWVRTRRNDHERVASGDSDLRRG